MDKLNPTTMNTFYDIDRSGEYMRLAPKAAQRVESLSTLEASFLCFQIALFVFVPSCIRVFATCCSALI